MSASADYEAMKSRLAEKMREMRQDNADFWNGAAILEKNPELRKVCKKLGAMWQHVADHPPT